MSNKTQLQINNTTVASLIETLRGKAAGGSSGDVSFGIFTVLELYGYSGLAFEFPFIIGSTWRQYIDSVLNIYVPMLNIGLQKFNISNETPGSPCVSHMLESGMPGGVSLEGTSTTLVDLDDVIEARTYKMYNYTVMP